MAYDFTIITALNAEDDETAKVQAANMLRAIAVLSRQRFIHFDKLGIKLSRPDGSEVELPEPQFPRGRRVG